MLVLAVHQIFYIFHEFCNLELMRDNLDIKVANYLIVNLPKDLLSAFSFYIIIFSVLVQTKKARKDTFLPIG